MTDRSELQRVIACDRIFNLRDFGGYRAGTSGRLAACRLFRSGQHAGATAGDLDRVTAMRLAVVCDLRGARERAGAPCPRPAGFAAQLIDIDTETSDPTAGALRQMGSSEAVETVAEAEAAMTALYARMPFRPALRQLYARYLRALADQDGATLVHCLAGKDRTGLAVALVHHIAGVHRDDMMADYLLTNVMPGRAEWLERMAEQVHHHYGGQVGAAALEALLSVRPEYLETALAAIRERYGDVDTYLDRELGIGREVCEAIGNRLVA